MMITQRQREGDNGKLLFNRYNASDQKAEESSRDRCLWRLHNTNAVNDTPLNKMVKMVNFKYILSQTNKKENHIINLQAF